MIITSSIEKFDTKKIKQSLNTQIRELSSTGVYDYFPTPVFKLVAPNGGETFFKDLAITASWYTFASPSMPTASLYYTFNDKDLLFIANVSNSVTTSFNWDLSQIIDNAALPSTSSYKFIVSGTYASNSISDKSLSTFSILSRSLKIIDGPIRGIVLGKKNVYPIQWDSVGLGSKIDLSTLVVESLVVPPQGFEEVPIVSSFPTPNTQQFNWIITSSNFIEGDRFIIILHDTLNPSLNASSSALIATNNLIETASGFKVSFPVLQTIDAQGIFAYREYAIEILDDVGVVYSPRSVIILTGNIGLPYVAPNPHFVFNSSGDIFLGEKNAATITNIEANIG